MNTPHNHIGKNTKTGTVNGADLVYVAHGPQSGRVGSLVVLLHGYGRNAKYMDKMAFALRERMPDAMVVAPHAPELLDLSLGADATVEDGARDNKDNALHIPQEVVAGPDGNMPSMLRQWFAIDGGWNALRPRMMNVARMVNEFIDTQRDLFSLNDKDIALMGFSQGGGVALGAAYTRGSPLRAVVGHSCVFFRDPSLNTIADTLLINGDEDPEFSVRDYNKTFDVVAEYTKGRATHRVMPGLGHYTNARSRAAVAEFIRDRFTA